MAPKNIPQLLFWLWAISSGRLTTVTVATDISPFKSIVNAPWFIDHTNFIKDFLRKIPRGKRLVLLTAPIGFGKTTNLDMLRRFLELTLNKVDGKLVGDKRMTENYQLFENLAISKEEEVIEKHFGEYPLIHMDFDNVGEDFNAGVLNEVRRTYDYYNALTNGAMKTMRLPPDNKANLTHAMNRVANLARKLSNHFDQKAVLLIDNYERPILDMIAKKATMEEIFHFNDQTLCALIRVIPKYVVYTVLTGIHPVLKASLVGGCRHPNSLKFLAEHWATRYYGFMQYEAEELFDRFQLTQEERNKVTLNCNGYVAENNFTSVYNMGPIVEYLKGKRPESESKLRDYPLRTGFLADNLYRFFRMSDLRAHFVGVLWYRRERVSIDSRIWITDLYILHDVLFTERKIEFAKTIFFTYLHETGHLHTGACPNFGLIPNDEVVRQLDAELRKYYVLKYNMKFDKVADSLYPIVTQLQTTDKMLRDLENSLTEMFKPLYETRHDLDGGRYIHPELEFETTIYCAASTRFRHLRGLLEVRVSDAFVCKLKENRNSADVIDDNIPGRIDMGIMSDDLKIALIIQICFNETLADSLDAISDLVPVHYKPQIVKYLAIGVGVDYKAYAGILANHNVSHLPSTKTLPRSDYSSYDVFDRSEIEWERGSAPVRKTTLSIPKIKKRRNFTDYIYNDLAI